MKYFLAIIILMLAAAGVEAASGPVRTLMLNTNSTLADSDTNFFKQNLNLALAAGLGGGGGSNSVQLGPQDNSITVNTNIPGQNFALQVTPGATLNATATNANTATLATTSVNATNWNGLETNQLLAVVGPLSNSITFLDALTNLESLSSLTWTGAIGTINLLGPDGTTPAVQLGTNGTGQLSTLNAKTKANVSALTVTNNINDTSGTMSIYPQGRQLGDSSTFLSLDWQNRLLADVNGFTAINWNNRILWGGTLGNSAALNWATAGTLAVPSGTTLVGNGGGVTNINPSAHKIISLVAPPNGDTNWFGPWTPGTRSAGVQEAINSLPLSANTFSGGGGGTIEFKPGTFYSQTNVHLPSLALSNPFSLSIHGAGMTASAFVYNGTAIDDLIHYGSDNSKTPYVFTAENMTFGSCTNAMTNIITLEGQDTTGGSSGGGVARGKIHFCYLCYWTSATNNNCFGTPTFTPSTCGDSVKHNLIGIAVNLNYNDPISITECSFGYCLSGISWMCDHGIVENNTFEQIGNASGTDWPNSSPFYAGPTILFIDNALGNGNKDWRYKGNNFVDCPLHYLSTLSFSPGYTADVNNIMIQDDTDEAGVCLAATVGAPITFYNPKGYYSLTNVNGTLVKTRLTTYAITNTANYSTWNTMAAPGGPAGASNVIAIVDFRRGTNTTSQQFGGALSALGGLYVGTNDTSHANPWNADFLQASGYRMLRITAATDDGFMMLHSGIAGSSNFIVAGTSYQSGLPTNSLVLGYSNPGADVGTTIPMMRLDALDSSAHFYGNETMQGTSNHVVNILNLNGPLSLSGSEGGSSQVLQSAGAGAAPTWATVATFTPGNIGGLTNNSASQAWTNNGDTQLGGKLYVSNNAAISGTLTVGGTITGPGSGITSLTAANLSGIVPLANLPGNILTNNNAGNVAFVGTISGNGSGVTNMPWELGTNVESFGAKGDAHSATNVWMASGSATIYMTNAVYSFSASDVGKVIVVANAGSSTSLRSIITNYLTANSVMVSNLAGATVKQTACFYGHDDTAAFQTAFNQLTNGDVTLYALSKGYMIDGPLQDTTGKNAQLILPDIGQSNNVWGPTLTVIGKGAPAELFNVNGNLNTNWNNVGTTIYSSQGTNTGYTGGAFFNAQNDTTYPVGQSYFNNVRVQWQNIGIQLPPAPVMSWLLMGYALGANIQNVGLHLGFPEYAGTTTTVNIKGIQMPFVNNSGGGVSQINQCFVYGAGTAYELSEHDDVLNACAESSLVGIQFDTSYYPVNIFHFNCTSCHTNLFINGVCTPSITALEVEHDPGFLTYEDLHDPNNYLTNSEIAYSVVRGNVGITNNWTQVGGSGALVRQMGHLPGLHVYGWQGPTNTLYLDNNLNTFTMNSPCAITNVSGLTGSYGTIRFYNNSGSNVVLTINASGITFFGNSTNSLTVPNTKSGSASFMNYGSGIIDCATGTTQ